MEMQLLTMKASNPSRLSLAMPAFLPSGLYLDAREDISSCSDTE